MTKAGSAPTETDRTAPAPPAAPVKPTTTRDQFECPACGRKFERHTRLGIWSKCPKCGARAYGRTVLDDIARHPARERTSTKAPATRSERTPATIGVLEGKSPKAKRPAGKPRPAPAPPTDPPSSPPPAAPPAAPPAGGGFLSRLLGHPD